MSRKGADAGGGVTGGGAGLRPDPPVVGYIDLDSRNCGTVPDACSTHFLLASRVPPGGGYNADGGTVAYSPCAGLGGKPLIQ